MKIVCNIPHSGILIPDWSLDDFVWPLEYLTEFHNKMVDKNVDLLFDFVPSENKVISHLSRIVVDMERYRNDEEEPMSKLGMGLFYTKDDKGNVIRCKGSTYNRCLSIYDNYWGELNDKIEFALKLNGECLILDCHSFHDGQTHMGYSISSYPDICIGFNGDTPPKEAELIKKFFVDKGYTVLYNIPFSGSIVPEKYKDDKRVKSVMIEFNRRIYNELSYFDMLHDCCEELLRVLD